MQTRILVGRTERSKFLHPVSRCALVCDHALWLTEGLNSLSPSGMRPSVCSVWLGHRLATTVDRSRMEVVDHRPNTTARRNTTARVPELAMLGPAYFLGFKTPMTLRP